MTLWFYYAFVVALSGREATRGGAQWLGLVGKNLPWWGSVVDVAVELSGEDLLAA